MIRRLKQRKPIETRKKPQNNTIFKKIKLSTKSPQPSEPSTICLSLKRGRSLGAAIESNRIEAAPYSF
jgi:hypothetical protein